jgi:hypothetical protein
MSDDICVGFTKKGERCKNKARYTGGYCGIHIINNNVPIPVPSFRKLIPENPVINGNVLWRTIAKYPERNWDWNNISMNLCTTLDIIEEFIDENIGLTWEFVSWNPNVDILFAKRYIKCLDWRGISQSIGITMEDIEQNSDLPWALDYVYKNRNLTKEFLKSHGNQEIGWSRLSMSAKYISIEDGDKWDYEELSKNESITPELVEQHLDKPWNFISLSGNSAISPSFIERHISERWDWKLISSNKSITQEFFLRRINKNWDFDALARNRSVPVNFVEEFYLPRPLGIPKSIVERKLIDKYTVTGDTEYIERPSHISYGYYDINYSIFMNIIRILCKEKDLSEDFIRRHKDVLSWDILSESLNMSENFIDEYSRYIHFHALSCNT